MSKTNKNTKPIDTKSEEYQNTLKKILNRKFTDAVKDALSWNWDIDSEVEFIEKLVLDYKERYQNIGQQKK